MTETTVFSPVTIRNRLRIYLTGQRPDGTKIEIPTLEMMRNIQISVLSHMTENLKLVVDRTEVTPGGTGEIDQAHKTDITNQRRRLVFGFIFGDSQKPLEERHTSQLDALAILALFSWIGAKKEIDPEDGRDRWTPRPGFVVEVNEMANAAWAWQSSPSSSEPLSVLLETLEKSQPAPKRPADETDLTSTGVLLGGVVYQGEKESDWPARSVNYQGIVIRSNSLPQNYGGVQPPDGSVWCEWCGENYTLPGVPCKKCKEMGVDAVATVRYVDDSGKTVTPAPPLYSSDGTTPIPASPKPSPTKDNRPDWMKGIKP